MANNNATVEKVLSGLPNVIEKATANGYRVRGYVSCVMTDPYAGPTAPEDVVKVAQRLLDMGCYEVSLGDTTGEGNPKAWVSLWQALIDAGVPVEKMAVSTCCSGFPELTRNRLIAMTPFPWPFPAFLRFFRWDCASLTLLLLVLEVVPTPQVLPAMSRPRTSCMLCTSSDSRLV